MFLKSICEFFHYVETKVFAPLPSHAHICFAKVPMLKGDTLWRCLQQSPADKFFVLLPFCQSVGKSALWRPKVCALGARIKFRVAPKGGEMAVQSF